VLRAPRGIVPLTQEESMDEMHQEFAFVDGDRTFTCRTEAPRAPRAEAWWWFRVSTDERNRYAPFRAVAGDTPDDVRMRVVAYYDNLLARRAEPPASRWHRR
jgi:hypothetical protein